MSKSVEKNVKSLQNLLFFDDGDEKTTTLLRHMFFGMNANGFANIRIYFVHRFSTVYSSCCRYLSCSVSICVCPVFPTPMRNRHPGSLIWINKSTWFFFQLVYRTITLFPLSNFTVSVCFYGSQWNIICTVVVVAVSLSLSFFSFFSSSLANGLVPIRGFPHTKECCFDEGRRWSVWAKQLNKAA